MSRLDVTKEKAAKLSEIEDLSLDTIKEALSGKVDAGEEEVKVATKMLSVVAKNRQTMTNRCAIEYNMAANVGTEEQLKKYVAVTNPQIQKALGAKK